MGTGSLRKDAREFLAVVGVASAGLTLAAAAAFVPWYGVPGHGHGHGSVVDVYVPAAPAAPAAAADER